MMSTEDLASPILPDSDKATSKFRTVFQINAIGVESS